MLPNAHSIYLHDTPAKDKFPAAARPFSHGCLRLSRPMDLVYRGVGDIVGWPPARIDKPFQCGKTTHVPLQEYILFHAAYATALRCANGIEFRPGVHGRGRWLYAALFGKPAS